MGASLSADEARALIERDLARHERVCYVHDADESGDTGRDAVCAVRSADWRLWKDEAQHRSAVHIVDLMAQTPPSPPASPVDDAAPDRKVLIKVVRKSPTTAPCGFFEFVERAAAPSAAHKCPQSALAVRQARDDLLRFVGDERPHAAAAAAATALMAVRDAVPRCESLAALLARLARANAGTGGALFSRCVRVFEAHDAFFFVFKYVPCSLRAMQRAAYEPLARFGTRRFVAFQLLRALADAHASGLTHGALSPDVCLLTKHCWLYVGGFRLRTAHVPRSLDDASPAALLQRWCARQLSNFDYLMALNHLAGRRAGWPDAHPILPWVHDLLVDPTLEPASGAGWRDLTRSKLRLARGDEQLDFTFLNTSSPHHLTDVLPDLTFYHYMARQTPVPILRRFVRSVWQPHEFPSSMQRMFAWSPCEAIPEFYAGDGACFRSIHADMCDIAVPPWCASVDEFLAKHRAALEDERVSAHLHAWIDLTFGFRLSGQPAIEAKNVPLRDARDPQAHGFVQLFTLPHPPRVALPTPGSASVSGHSGSLALQLDGAAAAPVSASPVSKPQQRMSQLAAAVESLEPVRRLNQLLRKNRNARLSVDEEGGELIRAAAGSDGAASGALRHRNSTNAEPPHVGAGEMWQARTVLDTSLLSNALFRDQALLEHAAAFEDAFARAAPVYRVSSAASSTWAALAADDVFAAGCVIAELFLERAVLDARTAQRPAQAIASALQRLPPSIAQLVAPMLALDAARRPLAAQLLDNDLFDAELGTVFEMLRDLKRARSPIARFDVAIKFLPRLRALPLDCFALALPVLTSLFEHRATQQAALLALTQPLSQKLGAQAAFALLLQPLRALFQDKDRAVIVLRPKTLQCLLDAFGSAPVIDHCLPPILERVRTADERTSALLVDTLQSLTALLGVPLCTRHVVAPLAQQLERARDIAQIANVAAAFVAVCVELPQNVICQILPPLTALLRRPEVRDGGDAGAEVALCVLSTLNRFVDEFDLATVLREFVQKSTLFVLLLNPSSNSRTMLALAGTIVHVAAKVGPTLTQELLLPFLRQHFAAYSEVYEFGPSGTVQLREAAHSRKAVAAYSSEMVALLYMPLRDLIGADVFAREIANSELLELLFRQSGKFARAQPSRSHAQQQRRDPTTLRRSIGAAFDVADWLCAHVALEDEQLAEAIERDAVAADDSAWLAADRGADVDRGAVERGERAPPWRYRGEAVHAFRAHQSGAAACIARSAHERPLLTGGRDSTVKLWSLESTNTAPLQTYAHASGTVHSAFFVGGAAGYHGADVVASCSAQLHVWSTERANRISLHQHDNASFVCCAVSTRSTHTAHVTVAAAAADGMLVLIDATQKRPTMLWALPKVLGVPRAIVCSDDGDWIAVGGSAGNAAILDQRTGRICGLWRVCDGGSGVVTGMSVTRDGLLATVATDGQLMLWSVPELTAVERASPLGGEPLTCMTDAGALFLVGGASGRVVGASRRDTGGFRVGRASAASQRSAVTSLASLALHRVVMAGFDDGVVRCFV